MHLILLNITNFFDWLSHNSNTITSISSIIGVSGIWLAFVQLRMSRKIAQLQFEDGMAKEYRDLASKIPTKALIGYGLSEDEYDKSFDELYRYLDLSNEQINLRIRKRISSCVWVEWCAGIKSNLQMPAFNRAWSEIQESSNHFQELRRLEADEFKSDPASWRKGWWARLTRNSHSNQ